MTYLTKLIGRENVKYLLQNLFKLVWTCKKMDKEKILIFSMALVLILSIFLIGLAFYLEKKDLITSPSETLPGCETLKFGKENALNVVFLTSDRESAEKYSEYLTNFGPFAERKELINLG